MWGNQTMKFALKALSLAVVAAASTFTYADEATSVHSVSGNIGVFSSYNLRGITNTPENEDATIQGGLGYSHASGFYEPYRVCRRVNILRDYPDDKIKIYP